MFETLRTMFDLSVGGVNNLFMHDFRGFYSPLAMLFLTVFSVFSVF